VVQIWPGLFTLVYIQISSRHSWTTLYLMAWAAHKFLTKPYLETKEPCNLRLGHWTLITEFLIWYLVLFFCSTKDKTLGKWAIKGTTLSCQPTFSGSCSTANTTKHVWRHHKPHLDYSSFICCSKYPTFLCCGQISRNYCTTPTATLFSI